MAETRVRIIRVCYTITLSLLLFIAYLYIVLALGWGRLIWVYKNTVLPQNKWHLKYIYSVARDGTRLLRRITEWRTLPLISVCEFASFRVVYITPYVKTLVWCLLKLFGEIIMDESQGFWISSMKKWGFFDWYLRFALNFNNYV